jgi:hypothetical protein
MTIYKLVCQHCDKEGYVEFTAKLPLYSENVNEKNFEILPHEDNGRVRIRHLCNQCHGEKYKLYNSEADWKLETIEPKPAKEQKD